MLFLFLGAVYFFGIIVSGFYQMFKNLDDFPRALFWPMWFVAWMIYGGLWKWPGIIAKFLLRETIRPFKALRPQPKAIPESTSTEMTNDSSPKVILPTNYYAA